VIVRNTGPRAGNHVVQLYGLPRGAEDFPTRVLLGFRPIQLAAGETGTLEVTGSIRPLQRWTGGCFEPAATTVVVEAAAYSGDPSAPTTAMDL
jgi:hypothetical protein